MNKLTKEQRYEESIAKPIPHQNDRLMSPSQVAKRLNVSRTTVYRLILGFKGEKGTLPAHKLGRNLDGKRHWHIWESDVMKLLERNDEIGTKVEHK